MPDTDPMFILADPDRAFELSNYQIRSWFDANGILISIVLKFILCTLWARKVTDQTVIDQISELTKKDEDSKTILTN
jgi:pyruvate,water dikinase